MKIEDYEKLGAFYLGRPVDAETGEDLPGPLLYDSKDLTTHAVIVGMTGSGKTGLAISLLEEALIDGVPVLAIDPKGDLGNLLLTFPELRAEDFRPWIDEGAAARAGQTPDAFAASQARLWREGLASWGQEPERLARLEAAAERVIYTPGSQAGRPLSVLRSLDAPPPATLEDEEALRERILSSVAGLLELLGIDADPLQSREHILLSTLIERAWREGRNLDMPSLIHQIQSPPIERVGILELETFYPADERFALVMRLNSLLASPAFAAWREGEPIDIGRMLRASDGRPRLSIVSIAHLSDAERMFVVTMLLGQLVSWTRAQSGSQSLRAILYMDEVFGYLPPTANPPSKTPMLTLLKQARAHGVGVVLATQNPVDLDYKALSNCGTWLLGRLQTERDKARVIEGLESAASAASGRLDRGALERTLSRLQSRVFLMNNVHEDEPVLLRSRWALSYLAGPLSRDQIERVSAERAAPAGAGEITATTGAGEAQTLATISETPVALPDDASESLARPVMPTAAQERFVPVTTAASASERLIYRPVLLARASIHYANARAGVDEWTQRIFWAPLAEDLEGSPWSASRNIAAMPELERRPEAGAAFAPPPLAAERAASYERWSRQLKSAIYREYPLQLWKSRDPKLVSGIAEDEGAFRGRLAELVREKRDLGLEKLRKKYAPKLVRMQERIARAEERVDREEQQYRDRRAQTVVSLGATLVGALFGRKLGSVGNVGRAASTMKGASRTAREKADIGRAEERFEAYQQRLAKLEAEFEEELERAEDAALGHEIVLEPLRIRSKKADLEIERLYLVWVPTRLDATGHAELAGVLEA
jgi:hypothetical protein